MLFRFKFFLLVLWFPVYGFSQSEAFKVNGKVITEYQGYVYLKYGGLTDSALVENNHFVFEGQVDYPVEASLTINNGYTGDSFYVEPGEMDIAVSIEHNLTFVEEITGNATHVILSDLLSFYEGNKFLEDFDRRLYSKLDTVIKQNPQSQFSGVILSEVIMDPVFGFEEAYALFSLLDTTTQDPETIRSINESLDKLKNIRIGNDFEHFALPDQNGKIRRTESLSHSVFLVEFWSSWCGPCRQANPRLVAIYNKYHGQGFDIFGVSLDENRDAWLKAIEKDKLPWANTLADEGFQNEIIMKLRVQALPANYLIDTDGKIIAINIRPAELEAKLMDLYQ